MNMERSMGCFAPHLKRCLSSCSADLQHHAQPPRLALQSTALRNQMTEKSKCLTEGRLRVLFLVEDNFLASPWEENASLSTPPTHWKTFPLSLFPQRKRLPVHLVSVSCDLKSFHLQKTDDFNPQS